MADNFQNSFAKYLLTNDQAELAELIKPEYLANISVHYDNFHESLIKILQNNFSQTSKLLGEKYFYQLAKEFSSKHLNTGLKLEKYGENFNEFVSNHKVIEQIPYIEEFINFEFQVNQILYTKRANTDNQETLQERVNLVSTEYNIRDIWYFTFNEDHTAPKIKKGDYNYLIYRKETIEILEIDPRKL